MLNYENQLNLGNIYSSCEEMFIHLVDVTEPICQAIDPFLANIDVYDTSSIESYVTENNPKYVNSSIKQLEHYYKHVDKDKSKTDIYKQAYCNLPMQHAGICHEKGRADRIKWHCPKTHMKDG